MSSGLYADLQFHLLVYSSVMNRRNQHPPKHPGLEALRHLPGACSCQKLRSASRAATRMYDEQLRPAGITIGQYSVLAALYYVPSMPLRKLARRLELDRTTLTRSIARLERDELVSVDLDPNDNRVRMIAITDDGLRRLVECYPLWLKAQQQLQKAVGAQALKEFRASLDDSIEALKAYR